MKLLETIVKAADEKRGEKIVSLDLRSLDGTVCDYFVVCSAESTVQVAAIAAEIEQEVFEKLGEKVIRTHGTENALWIAMDYGDIMVHIFQNEMRSFYRLEDLWADASITSYESTL
ncbi:MAG: ribosome silencing factor [Mucinivorans sp.]